MSKATVLAKCIAGALLGYLLAGFVSMSLGIRLPPIELGFTLVVTALAGIAAIRYLAILFVAFIAIYFASFWNMTRRVNDFCESITASTKPSELPRLAEQNGLVFRVFKLPNSSDRFYGSVPNPFTMGDHACRVSFTKEKILSAKANTH